MATVTLRQSTNMAASVWICQQASDRSRGSIFNVDEFYLHDDTGDSGDGNERLGSDRLSCERPRDLPSFPGTTPLVEMELVAPLLRSRSIPYDPGCFVNLDITGLSFTFSNNYFFAVILRGQHGPVRP